MTRILTLNLEDVREQALDPSRARTVATIASEAGLDEPAARRQMVSWLARHNGRIHWEHTDDTDQWFISIDRETWDALVESHGAEIG